MGSPVVITPDPPAAAPVEITPDPPKRTWMDSAGDAIKEWWNQVNPAEALRGVDLMTRHPIDTATKMLQAQDQPRIAAEEAFKKGDYATGVRHVLNYFLPFLGNASDQAGDLLQNPDTRAQGVGATAGILTNIAAPAGVEAAAAKVAPAASRALLLGRTPEEAYQSALKPSTTLSEAQRANIVETGLRERIPVSQNGVERLSGLIDDVNNKIKDVIAADPTRKINPAQAVKDIGQVRNRFATQVNPNADLAAIDASKDEFLDQFRSQPGGAVRNMTAEEAQAMKQGTYRALGNKAYGELKGASIEAQKALARGLKEEIAVQFPEIQSLNARDSQLLDLQPVLEKAVNRIGNHQMFGIGTPIAASATKAVTGSGGLAAVAGTLKMVLDNPAVKSRLAIALSKTGVAPITAWQRVNAYHAALGAALQASHSAADAAP